jgi:uncharacterized protein
MRAHFQTWTAALPAWRPSPPQMRHEIARLAADDGSTLVAVCAWQPHTAPAVVVVHGVGGSSDDPYIVRAGRSLEHAGFHVVRINQRGSGLGVGLATRLYHAAFTDDLAVVRAFLATKPDVDGVGIVGFSLGGHVALSHAAELEGGAGSLGAVVAVSPPVDLAEGMRRFDDNRRGPFFFYERWMVKGLIRAATALLAGRADPVFARGSAAHR